MELIRCFLQTADSALLIPMKNWSTVRSSLQRGAQGAVPLAPRQTTYFKDIITPHKDCYKSRLSKTQHSTADVPSTTPTQFDIDHAPPLRAVSVNERSWAVLGAVRRELAKSNQECWTNHSRSGRYNCCYSIDCCGKDGGCTCFGSLVSLLRL